MICSTPGCDNPSKAKGLCGKCYKRARRAELVVPSSDHRALSESEWRKILDLVQLSDTATDFLVGFTGPWREHCRWFRRNLHARIAAIRQMTLPQQCRYYREAAFIQMGQ